MIGLTMRGRPKINPSPFSSVLYKVILRAIVLMFLSLSMLISGSAWALSTSGTPIIVIDGNRDSNTTVGIFSMGFTLPYSYGYFLNGDTSTPHIMSQDVEFKGGDVIDLWLDDGTGLYSLSGDMADTSYSVTMGWGNQVNSGAPQQPFDWSNPYYHSVNITWDLPSNSVNTGMWAKNSLNGNDGIAPVPEPSTLLLLGSGLLGLGYFGRKRMKGKS